MFYVKSLWAETLELSLGWGHSGLMPYSDPVSPFVDKVVDVYHKDFTQSVSNILDQLYTKM